MFVYGFSSPCRNWNISRLWSIRACEEFYRQGDRERELDLPVTPFCDRSNISVAKVSEWYFQGRHLPSNIGGARDNLGVKLTF